MILLDTDVVSEGIKPEPHPSILAWLDVQAAGDVVPLQHQRSRPSLRLRRVAGRQAKGHAGHADRPFAGPVRGPHPALRYWLRRGATRSAPSRRAGPEKASPLPTATLPRSPPLTGSPWRRATLARSRLPASPSSTRGRRHRWPAACEGRLEWSWSPFRPCRAAENAQSSRRFRNSRPNGASSRRSWQSSLARISPAPIAKGRGMARPSREKRGKGQLGSPIAFPERVIAFR